MRKITTLFFLLLCFVFQAQEAIQIELVDGDIGHATYVYDGPNVEPYDDLSNDEGLNLIFLNHNVTVYESAHAYQSTNMMLKVGVAYCTGCDVDQFVLDLRNYNSVIKYAVGNSGSSILSNGLFLNLVDDNVGSFQSYNNDIVITNDAGLNQIFLDFGVRYYENVNVGTSWEKYELACDCDANLLKAALEDYSTVISNAENIYLGFLLSNIEKSFDESVKIYPNPFKTKVNLESSFQLTSIELFDILGKRVYNSSDVSGFENYSETLKSGVYILKLVDQNKNTLTKKLIKN